MKHAAQTGLSVVADAVTVSVPDARNGRPRKTLLKGVSFRIRPGDFVCVLGPSGAGKRTLVRAILGEREITNGRLLVGGHDVFREADALRGAIGYVPQRDVNPEALPVERALHYAAEVRLPAEASAADRQAAIDRVVAEVGLDSVRHETIVNLSGGEMKRASLAAEMLAAPGLLILDEATSSLDIPSERLVQRALRTVLARRTALIIAHRLSTVEIADRVLVVEHGRVVEDGSPRDLIGSGGHYAALHRAWVDSLA
jgi:ABC-type multidrug transport system ATPase subunit